MLDLQFCSLDDILMRRKSLRRTLSEQQGLKPLRIAVLGGSITDEVVNLLEIQLLASGFQPVFHQSEYSRYYEDAVHDPASLVEFRPDIVYIHTSYRNVQNWPPLTCSEADLLGYVDAELRRYTEIWDALERNVACQVIQNNFETLPHAPLANLDAVAAGGHTRFLMELNLAFARAAAKRPTLMLQDVHSLSARLGMRQWFDWKRYFSYKLLLTADANLELARNLNGMIKAIYGKTKKMLVLDLDNTLWGGVIGDDGVDRIQIGRETPVAEAYTAFQEYCLSLRERGILLAVCSKNNEEIAKAGFEHPSSVLKLEHFSCFIANWEPKHDNIRAIAAQLNLGVDSLVFVDDNPAERDIVSAQVPEVAVPNIGSDVTEYAGIIERGGYFEPLSLSKEDMERAALYADNSKRAVLAQKFANYGEYLDSLEMVAEIDCFKPVYLERIAQLTNKTNQFNLTTRRYSLAEMEAIVSDSDYIGLYGALRDRCGDNGLISAVLGRQERDVLHMDLWLMSCRVLKRDMEIAMLDAVAMHAQTKGIRSIIGYYLPTKKNGMVADFYERLGFLPASIEKPLPEGSTIWTLELADYKQQNKHIKIEELTHA